MIRNIGAFDFFVHQDIPKLTTAPPPPPVMSEEDATKAGMEKWVSELLENGMSSL